MIYDVAVVGGGLVGAALAYGLRTGEHACERVAVLDEGDVAYRASRGNFGLVWVQSKGLGMPAYSAWTQASARAWPGLAAALLARTGVDVHLEQNGGLNALLSEQEAEFWVNHMTRLMAQPGMPQYQWQLLARNELADLVPGIGPDVQGAIWTPLDGIVNPLKLLRALHIAFDRLQVDYLPRRAVTHIRRANGVFAIDNSGEPIRAHKIVLAAGLGNAALGEQLGMHVPVRPQRGQIIVLERTRRMLEVPMMTLRQMDEGTWIIGDSAEEAGYQDHVAKLSILGVQAARAVRILPALRAVRAVRTWSALRVMSADGWPIYQQSETMPGAFVATCHSGVTLAAAHASVLAPMIARGRLDDVLAPFATRRFHVQAAQ